MAVYLTSWLFINACAFYGRKEPIIVWLTYWGYMVLCCHLVTAAVITTYHTYKDGNWRNVRVIPLEQNCETQQEQNGDVDLEKETKRSIRKTEPPTTRHGIPWYMRMNWVFFNISCPAAVEVTALYFFFMFPKVSRITGFPFPTVDNFHVHAFNSMVIFFEVMLAAFPVRMLHFIHPILFGVLYLICTVIYWATDHTIVLYDGVINWNKPGKTLLRLLVMAFVGTIIIHLVFFGLYKLKLYLNRRLMRKTSRPDDK